jgi:hypothetical protein
VGKGEMMSSVLDRIEVYGIFESFK